MVPSPDAFSESDMSLSVLRFSDFTVREKMPETINTRSAVTA